MYTTIKHKSGVYLVMCVSVRVHPLLKATELMGLKIEGYWHSQNCRNFEARCKQR